MLGHRLIMCLYAHLLLRDVNCLFMPNNQVLFSVITKLKTYIIINICKIMSL